MPTCTRNGCKKEYALVENIDGACRYHPGAPVFHEGLKSWSCCSDVNKPELDFDEFMKIEGCQTGVHTTERIVQPEKLKSPAPGSLQVTQASDGKETFTAASVSSFSALPPATSKPSKPIPLPVEEEEDLSQPVTPGTRCKRNGCNVEFISDEESRLGGDGDHAVCTYHPSSPIFHEGSKGYLCCKRRVLEFDEFLKIEGCKKGKHLFVPKKADTNVEIQTTCRLDHYQTPQSVCVSIFAKQADKTRSVVSFTENEVHLDLFLPDSKRFTRSLSLFGPIIPEESKHMIMGTKVELDLKKKDNRSWNLLEKTDQDLGGFSLTFGVGGRTGTIGSRAPPVLAENNPPKV